MSMKQSRSILDIMNECPIGTGNVEALKDLGINVDSKTMVLDTVDNIILRLENNRGNICLYDAEDSSKICISDDLINIIKSYYKCKKMERD